MNEETRLSEFNELAFKMLRVHKLQDQINELWINPLVFNNIFGEYNYNLIIANIESLYAEVHSKCNTDERKEAAQKFEAIENLISEIPVYDSRTHPTAKKSYVNSENWKQVKSKIKELNLFVRDLLDNHGFSPDKDDDDTKGL